MRLKNPVNFASILGKAKPFDRLKALSSIERLPLGWGNRRGSGDLRPYDSVSRTLVQSQSGEGQVHLGARKRLSSDKKAHSTA